MRPGVDGAILVSAFTMYRYVPREVMFPDFYAARRAAGTPAYRDDRAFMLTTPYQVADQKCLDGVMKYYEELNKR